MNEPVSFNNLREITDGDRAIEAALFVDFITSSNVCIEGLQAAIVSSDQLTWRKHAHAFKGISFSLGALPLGRLCQAAEEGCANPWVEKQELLLTIRQELQRVLIALKKEVSSIAGHGNAG